MSAQDCPQEIQQALLSVGWYQHSDLTWWHPTLAGMYYLWYEAAAIAIRNSKLPDEE